MSDTAPSRPTSVRPGRAVVTFRSEGAVSDIEAALPSGADTGADSHAAPPRCPTQLPQGPPACGPDASWLRSDLRELCRTSRRRFRRVLILEQIHMQRRLDVRHSSLKAHQRAARMRRGYVPI